MLKVILFFLLIAVNSFATPTDFVPSFRMQGGHRAKAGEHPYQVLIRFSKSKSHFCGGSILNESFIITAAQCMYNSKMKKLNASELVIIAGQIEFEKNNSTVERKVRKITTHPRFNKHEFDHDLALLELTENLHVGNNSNLTNPETKPIKLNEKEVVEDLNCTVTGWGAQRYNKKIKKGLGNSKILKRANFTTITWSSCRRYFKQRKKISISAPPGTFCAWGIRGRSNRPVGACQDDTGGPLVCNGLLTGIVSKQSECGTHPGIYTDVPWHSQWILFQREEPEFDTRRGRGSTRRAGSSPPNSSPKLFFFNYLLHLFIVIAIKF